MIWYKQVTLIELQAMHVNSMQEYIGIEFMEIGEDFIRARMPVDHRTKQPLGLLHGGASVVLAESLGSIATMLTLNPDEKICVGLEINANHIRTMKDGFVYGITKPLHIGKSTQVWEIKMYNEKDQLTCVSRITNAILDKR
jgi:1,4-dihydroxy-2-naphthoyl-CoA hydrolase